MLNINESMHWGPIQLGAVSHPGGAGTVRKASKNTSTPPPLGRQYGSAFAHCRGLYCIIQYFYIFANGYSPKVG